MSHPALDRRNCAARTAAILAGHSVLCAEVGADPDCQGPEPVVSAAGEEPPILAADIDKVDAYLAPLGLMVDRETYAAQVAAAARSRKPDPSPLPPPAHLALGEGATHPGLLVDCGACACHDHAAHPEARVPAGYGGGR